MAVLRVLNFCRLKIPKRNQAVQKGRHFVVLTVARAQRIFRMAPKLKALDYNEGIVKDTFNKRDMNTSTISYRRSIHIIESYDKTE